MSNEILPDQSVERQVSKKESLIKAAAELFTKKGYHGTSTNDIAKACQIQKASLFHHFERKQDILLQAIAALHEYCRENLFIFSQDMTTEPQVRIDKFIHSLQSFFVTRVDAALVSFISPEIFAESELFDDPIKKYFDDWFNAIKELLLPLHNEAQSIVLARDSLVIIQGTLLMQRVYQDISYIEKMCENLELAWTDKI